MYKIVNKKSCRSTKSNTICLTIQIHELNGNRFTQNIYKIFIIVASKWSNLLVACSPFCMHGFPLCNTVSSHSHVFRLIRDTKIVRCVYLTTVLCICLVCIPPDLFRPVLDFWSLCFCFTVSILFVLIFKGLNRFCKGFRRTAPESSPHPSTILSMTHSRWRNTLCQLTALTGNCGVDT